MNWLITAAWMAVGVVSGCSGGGSVASDLITTGCGGMNDAPFDGLCTAMADDPLRLTWVYCKLGQMEGVGEGAEG